MTGRENTSWAALETLVSSIEERAYDPRRSSEFLQFVASELASALHLMALAIDHFRDGRSQRLALSGAGIGPSGVSESAVAILPGEARARTVAAGKDTRLEIDHCYQPDRIVRLTALGTGGIDSRQQEVLTTIAVIVGQHLIRVSAFHLAADVDSHKHVLRIIQELATVSEDSSGGHQLCALVQRGLGVDRCSLLAYRGGQARLLASSATPRIRRQTELVRRLQRMARTFLRNNLPLRFSVGESLAALPGVVQPAVDAYLEESSVRLVREIPLPAPSSQDKPDGILLLEHFGGDWPDDAQQSVLQIAEPHLQSAAHQWLRLRRRTVFSRLTGWLATAGGRWLAAAALLGAITAAALLVQVDLEISAEGTLLPRQRRAVFAPAEGIVEELLAAHGSPVAAGDPLVKLRSPELDLEREQLQGDLSSLQTRLDGLAAARLRNRVTGSSAGDETELSALEADLRAQLKGTASELQILERQQTELMVRSPLSGQVDRWNLESAFSGRPVAHGQFLVDVLDVRGPWEVELRIPDDEIAAVLNAQSQQACRVTYIFRTQPDRRHESRLEELAQTAQMGADRVPFIAGRMPVSDLPSEQLRVGASVLAHVHCGKRCAGYVYLRDVIEFLQRTFWI